ARARKGSFNRPVEILTACNGDEALEAGNKGPIDILITDFMMPGMSGLNLIESFQKTTFILDTPF
ncbi:MAG: response regulator, partial [Anaerolineae bacterium]|nr:response regulator [Anaerolineae bacterium]